MQVSCSRAKRYAAGSHPSSDIVSHSYSLQTKQVLHEPNLAAGTPSKAIHGPLLYMCTGTWR